jgi:hypothetical protein
MDLEPDVTLNMIIVAPTAPTADGRRSIGSRGSIGGRTAL